MNRPASRRDRIRIVALFAIAACAVPKAAPPSAAVGPGTAIAIYGLGGEATTVVDDRRWVEAEPGVARVALADIDPRAELASLIVEPLGENRLELGACARDRLPGDWPALRKRRLAREDAERAPAEPPALAVTPVVRCAVRAGRGRALVRVVYTVPRSVVRADHELVISAADRAAIVSRFAIATVAAHGHAEVTLYDRAPGGELPPRLLARGRIALDGGIAVLAVARREVAARLIRVASVPRDAIAAGAPNTPGAPGAPIRVWSWLELAETLPAGRVRAHVELAGEPARDVDVDGAAGRALDAGRSRLPLWIDPALSAAVVRRRAADASQGDYAELAIANAGPVAREVWIEPPPRGHRRRTAVRMWPGPPVAVGGELAVAVSVGAGKLEHGGFELGYAP